MWLIHTAKTVIATNKHVGLKIFIKLIMFGSFWVIYDTTSLILILWIKRVLHKLWFILLHELEKNDIISWKQETSVLC